MIDLWKGRAIDDYIEALEAAWDLNLMDLQDTFQSKSEIRPWAYQDLKDVTITRINELTMMIEDSL